MTFRLDYMDGRPPRKVDGLHFAQSIIYLTVGRLAVGDSTQRFQSAGYKKITRIA